MPGMRVFGGRRCALATDDFLLIGIVDSILFLPWLGWLPVVYASFLKNRAGECDDWLLTLLHVSLPGLCALFLLNWLLAALFVIFSSRGTISNPEPRRHVVTLVYVKLVLSSLDVVWAVLGSVILAREGSFCDAVGVGLVIKACTVFQWLATVVRLGMIFVFFDWRGSSKRSKDCLQTEYFTDPVRRGTRNRWNIRLQTAFLWCTTSSEARKQAIQTISEILACLSCDTDLVVSDVIAGLTLYTKKCFKLWKTEKIALAQAPLISTSDGSSLDHFPPRHLPPWMNLQLASRYLDIGMGVFGWSWFIYRHPNCGCCMLFKRLMCCFPFRKRSRSVEGDNCCGCNVAGLTATTSLPYQDLVHVSFVDRVFEVPFYVCFDHQTAAVVVSCRGTLSADDVLTDICAGAEPLPPSASCPEGSLAHKGMFHAAREIRRRLAEEGILEEAFKEKPGYRLVVTGHSLGAAVASILTMLLHSDYPDVACFAFAPPPTLSRAALPLSERIILTVLYGNDSVPYLSYENVKKMLLRMAAGLQTCDMPKYKIFLSSDYYLNDCNSEEKLSNIDTPTKENGIKKGPGGDTSGDVESVDIEEQSVVTESVYVAGTILHIRPGDNGYRLRVASPEEYRPLSIRPRSVLHHFPQYTQKALAHLGKGPMLRAEDLQYPTQEKVDST